MRIAVDYTAAVNQTAGIGRFVRSLISAVVAIDQQNQYLLVHARPNAGAVLEFPSARNVTRRELPVSERWLNILWHRANLPIPINIFTGAVDLIHSPDFVLPPLRHTPSILTVHDLAFLLFPECAHESLREYLLRVVPRSARRASFIVADSENTANDVICLLGIPPDRVAVVPGGVDPRFRPVEEPARLAAMRQQLGVGTSPYVLFVGVIEPRKNLQGLIQAFELVKQRQKLPHKLVVVGRRGWLADGIFETFEQSPVRDEIIFPGFIADADLPTLYSAAATLVMPSFYEGFGLPLLEAMACGTPVVSSNAASLPEVVGNAAPQVDPNDIEALAEALTRVLMDEELRALNRVRGLERAARFTWEAAAVKLLNVYERVGAEVKLGIVS
ncbi:MAG: glycosyltransferase family 4 protein [Chloroflexota bacterium]